ncbi:GDYXXLXY domain-containing protein [Shewanella sp. 125m-7]
MTVLAFIGLINWDIYQKELHLELGEVVRLQLAPVDPRSLIQGDYMALNYAIAAKLNVLTDRESSSGLLQVKLDKNQVAQLVSVDKEGKSSTENSQLIDIQYRVRNHHIKFASNAYFFEEGKASRFEAAKYGQFRVNENGALLLESMLDKDFKPL